MASYVWAKYLDIISYGAEGGLGPRNPLDFRQSYGPSDSDVRNRFTSSYIYQLPKLKDAHGVVAGLINDWQNQGVLICPNWVALHDQQLYRHRSYRYR